MTFLPTSPSAWLAGALAASLPLSGCFLSPIPDLRTPADHAHEVEARCKRVPEDSASWLLSPDAIDRVEPALSYVQSGNDRRPNLRGARIHVRPMPGLTVETMERSLKCHQTRVTLGQVQASADDPYVLPGRWVDTDAEVQGDEFIVLVRVNSIPDAHVVLDRARRFAGTKSPSSP